MHCMSKKANGTALNLPPDQPWYVSWDSTGFAADSTGCPVANLVRPDQLSWEAQRPAPRLMTPPVRRHQRLA